MSISASADLTKMLIVTQASSFQFSTFKAVYELPLVKFELTERLGVHFNVGPDGFSNS